jgi:hypothetical protein
MMNPELFSLSTEEFWSLAWDGDDENVRVHSSCRNPVMTGKLF